MNTLKDLKTAVLVHMYDSRIKDWEEIMWGDPKTGRLGRASKGLQEAWKWTADNIIFSDALMGEDGITESQRTLEYVKTHVTDLVKLFPIGASEILSWLSARVVIDGCPRNTPEEIMVAAEFSKKHQIGRLVLVSSPTHIMRCHKAAISILGADPVYRPLLHNLYAVASDTCYADSTVDDVIIIDPPCQSEMSNVRFCDTMKEILPFLHNPELAPGLNKELREIIEKWRQKL